MPALRGLQRASPALHARTLPAACVLPINHTALTCRSREGGWEGSWIQHPGMGSNVRRRPLVPAAVAHAADKDARKGRLREECLARVQHQRSAMLWQLRQVRQEFVSPAACSAYNGGGYGKHAHDLKAHVCMMP